MFSTGRFYFHLPVLNSSIEPLSTERIRFSALKSFISALDFDWPFSRPIKLSVSFDDADRFINNVWLDFMSDEELRKINTMLLTILKFCTPTSYWNDITRRCSPCGICVEKGALLYVL